MITASPAVPGNAKHAASQGFNLREGFFEANDRRGKKNIFLIARVTPEEKKEFSKIAKAKHVSIEQLTRDLFWG